MWIVYVLISVTGDRTYVGITRDKGRRLRQHNGELPGGARSTRAGRPWLLGAVSRRLRSQGDALRLEHAVKQLRGRRRLDELVALATPRAVRGRRPADP